MYRTYEARAELAEKIYDLDVEVYEILGSGLGRVFNSRRDSTVRDLAKLMGTPTQLHILRSEIALIGNMARTISDRTERERVLEEYERIVKEIETLPEFFGGVDILDEDIARMNRSGSSHHLHQPHLRLRRYRHRLCSGWQTGRQLLRQRDIYRSHEPVGSGTG